MHPLDGCRAKLQRADYHIQQLNRRIHELFDRAPYGTRREVDQETGELVFFADAMALPVVPLDVPLMAGEVAYQLRSALDHLVWQLVLAHTQRPPTGNRSGFPIFLTAAGYLSRAPVLIKGVSKMAHTRIKAAQPYHLGALADQASLWVVHDLNNTDKHRVIPITTPNVHIGAGVMTPDGETYTDFLKPGILGQRLKDGTEIARLPFRREYAEMQVEVYYGSDVAFEQVGGLVLPRVPSLLKDVCTEVRELIESFRGEFPRISEGMAN